MVKTKRATSLVTAAAFTAVFAGGAFAQSADDLKNDDKTPGDVLVYGMGYAGQRYSPLTQINKQNVGKMVPMWAFSITDNRGAEAFPVIKDGVIYTTAHNATVAVDAMTGKQIWRVNHEYPPETLRVVCCGIVNRGAAIYNGKIIRALLDNYIIALDAKTGKEVWKTKSPEPVSIESRICDDGRAACRQRRGRRRRGRRRIQPSRLSRRLRSGDRQASLAALYDSRQGRTGLRHLGGRFPTDRRRQQLGDRQLRSGARSGLLGHRQPVPWNPRARKGDNLFTNSIFAVRPKTGERVWYYQTSPHDPFDYDAVQTPVIATIDVGGQPRKVVMQANRSGMLYVLDAKDGKLLAANPYGKVNWADGVDLKTGRPNFTQVYKDALEGKNVTVWPSVTGVTNWQHMSFNPQTKLLYINTAHVGMTYEAAEPPKLVPGKPSGPGTVKRTTVLDDPNIRGYLKAVDPMTGKSKWETPTRVRTSHRP